MTAFCSYTGSESSTPLIYCFVYDVLSGAVPHTQQALTQLVEVIYAFLVDPLLLALQPISYNPRGLYLGCLGATGREKWSLASLGVKWRLCHAPCAQVRSPVGIWNCATWSESERRLLSWSTAEGEAVAMHQGNIRWQFHIPTGQHTCGQGAIDQWRARLTTDISSFTR